MAKTRASPLIDSAALSIAAIHKDIVTCSSCPRLQNYCSEIAHSKRKSYLKEIYWGKPIPGFGAEDAKLIIVGLAPGAHGANRTGRVFTGDRSGEWLYRALFKSGFANQPQSLQLNDGLILNNCYITCAVKCAPPDNKPTPAELKTCSTHFARELESLKKAKIYLALGQIAYNALWTMLVLRANLNFPIRRPDFGHGTKIALPDGQWLLLSYHPSQQNTFTRRLTESMFDGVFEEAKSILSKSKAET